MWQMSCRDALLGPWQPSPGRREPLRAAFALAARLGT